MRAPDAALIRARARAPLRDLQALHLSDAGIECIQHLEASCHVLRSLYADENRLKDLEGLLCLRRLWRVDLNGNQLHGVHASERLLSPLASFAALGFLYLERNQLRFQDLACLRDVHIMELRVLEGNPALVRTGSSEAEYRMKVIALLPNVWVLDGHYVATTERERALDEYDAFVQSLLGEMDTGGGGGACDKFGSTAKLWGGVVSEDTVCGEQNENVALLIEHIDTKRVRNAEIEDRRRLHTIISLHNEEGVVHNTHRKFAPSKFAPNARAMPRIPLQELLEASRSTRIEVTATLAAYLEFGFARELLVEALVIQLLECERISAEELACLPPYATTALLCILRHHALEEDIEQPSPPDLERILWTSMPPLFTTLLRYDKDTRREGTEQLFATRCAFVVGLLSRAASFPDSIQEPRFKRRGAADANGLKSAAQLLQLVKVAKSSGLSGISGSATEDDEIAGASESIFMATSWVDAIRFIDADDTKGTTRKPWKTVSPARDYPRPWKSGAVATTSQFTSAPDPRLADMSQSQTKRKPRIGEWIEIRPKQFLKIRQLSEDGEHVVAFATTETSTSIPIHVDHLSRVSSSLWRLDESAFKQLSIGVELARSQYSLRSASKLGKLHRDSEGFHRHGAARSQGFPNHFVTNKDLREMERLASDNQQTQDLRAGPSEQLAQPVALFASTDTIDTNFVLAPPQMVSAQNYCATRSFRELGQSPVGLWSPIKHAPFVMLGSATAAAALISQGERLKNTGSGRKSLASVNAVGGPEVRTESTQTKVKVDDDWALLQREMESVLRMKPRQSAQRPSATPEQPSVRSHDDVLCFMTSVPTAALNADSNVSATEHRGKPEDSELLVGAFDTSSTLDQTISTPIQSKDAPNAQTALRTSPALASQQAKTRRAASSTSWHRVSTKPQLLVSSNSVPTLGRHTQQRYALPSSVPRVQPQHQPQQQQQQRSQQCGVPPSAITSEGPRTHSADHEISQCRVVLPALAQSRPIQQTDSM